MVIYLLSLLLLLPLWGVFTILGIGPKFGPKFDPKQNTASKRKSLFVILFIFSLTKPSYLKSQDDGPDETKCEPVAAVDDVVSAHVLQVYPLLMQECEGLVYVLQAVNAHLAFSGTWLKVLNIASNIGLTWIRICPLLGRG